MKYLYLLLLLSVANANPWGISEDNLEDLDGAVISPLSDAQDREHSYRIKGNLIVPYNDAYDREHTWRIKDDQIVPHMDAYDREHSYRIIRKWGQGLRWNQSHAPFTLCCFSAKLPLDRFPGETRQKSGNLCGRSDSGPRCRKKSA